MKKLLPLGTVVTLVGGDQKLMIISRGSINGKTECYYDYLAGYHPQGVDVNNVIFFNTENIEHVIAEGYAVPEEEEAFEKVYSQWIKDIKIPRGVIEQHEKHSKRH